MKKTVLLLFILIRVSAFSQSCLPEGINFLNQYQIDQFSYYYPDCKKIEGDVIIGDWGGNESIINLDGLSQLTSIGGNVSILSNEVLFSLAGLDSLNSIDGYLFIWKNAELTNLDELSSLITIGNALAIIDNENLSSLQGLSSLNSIGAELRISLNSSLESLSGLEHLESIETFLYIQNNENLIDISGINNIDPYSINGKFKITDNPLLSVCANDLLCQFMAISSDSLEVSDNNEGCNNLTEIESNCDTLSVNNQEFEDELVIFPNPTKRFLTFKTPQESKLNEVLIYDMSGQVVMAFASNATNIDISGLKPGVFILELIFEKASPVRRLIVKE